jgi:protein-disulfide isomerase
VNTGRAFVAFRHLPLETIHPQALRAAAMAECGRRQGKFWELHDAIFLASPQELQTLSSTRLAKSFAVDGNKLENCLKGDGATTVRRDAEFANALGVHGTPTFLLG